MNSRREEPPKMAARAGRRPTGGRRKTLDAPALGRTATIVRDRGDVADRRDRHADRLKRAQRRLAARTGSLDLDLDRAPDVLHRLATGRLGGHLRGERGRLARTLEALRTRRRPSDG